MRSGVVAVDQPQPDGLVGEQLRGPFDDRLEHVVDREPRDDRALDARETFEQELPLAERLEEDLVLGAAPFALEAQLAFGAHRPDRPQGQGEHPGNSAQQVRLLTGERRPAPSEDQMLEAVILDRHRDRVARADPGNVERSRLAGGDRAQRNPRRLPVEADGGNGAAARVEDRPGFRLGRPCRPLEGGTRSRRCRRDQRALRRTRRAAGSSRCRRRSRAIRARQGALSWCRPPRPHPADRRRATAARTRAAPITPISPMPKCAASIAGHYRRTEAAC